ncbi:MAG: HEPN domain-containing protein, partial [Clostridiales bacterium]|nr:HEPN domain-containing protein [Clostridiales bacterium]
MGKGTYKYIADRDLKDAETLLAAGSFSSAGRFAQQVVEKYLKHFIDSNGNTDDIAFLATHNTIKLYDKVVELGGLEFNRDCQKMMCVLRNYYYDVNYPGEDFRELGKEEATDA